MSGYRWAAPSLIQGGVTAVTYSNGRVATFVQDGISWTVNYDVKGRVSTLTSSAETVTYNYDSAGNFSGTSVT